MRPVFEFNGLVLLHSMRESPLSRYDYRLCESCGLVYASQRPDRTDLAFLYSHFDEFLGRDDRTMPEQTIRDRLAHGWLSSEEAEHVNDDLVRKVFNKQISESAHVPVLAASVPLRGMRILELRATTGLMLDMFRKYFGAAEVFAMPASDYHRSVISALNPMPTAIVDFDALEIPFEGTFDLVIARHMMTHASNLEALFAALHRHMSPDGWLYLLLENDDAAMFARRKNLFGEMKCFHFQNFDVDTLGRVLRVRGFEPEFIRHTRDGRSELLALARRANTAKMVPMREDACKARVQMYQEWRDRSILSAPDEVKALAAAELPAIEARALDRGYAIRDKRGRVAAAKPLKVMHDEGYAAINEEQRDA